MDQKHTDLEKTLDEVGRWTSPMEPTGYGVPWASPGYPQALGRTPVFIRLCCFMLYGCVVCLVRWCDNPRILLDWPQPPVVYSHHKVASPGLG